VTPRVVLRHPALEDEREFIALANASVELHRPWITAPSTPESFRRYLETMARPENCGFLVCAKGSGQIAGVINLTNIVLGLFRSSYLGYYAFAGFERQGLMREGLRAVVRYAFRDLGLHRLEANVQPGNGASIALVKSLGFVKEGYSPRYLKIGGRWRDHERWAMLAS
jgi:ribosomal-protein-alanine N-acetyltransferase